MTRPSSLERNFKRYLYIMTRKEQNKILDAKIESKLINIKSID